MVPLVRLVSLKFEDGENWLGSLVSGQADDLDFGLSEAMEWNILG